MKSLEDLRERDRRDGPTMREMHEMADSVKRMFPRGTTVHGSKPTDPSEGDMYVEDDRQVMVYVGGVWKKLVVSPPVPAPIRHPWDPSMHTPLGFEWPHDPETVGLPPKMSWADDPAETVTPPEDPDAVEPRGLEELLEVLLCPNCEFELSATACTPEHAYLADHPEEHRLIKPLVARSVDLMRWTTGKTCGICSVAGEPSIAMGTGDCKHVEVRGEQVRMSKAAWEEVCDEAAKYRGMEAAISDASMVHALTSRLAFYGGYRESWTGDDWEYWKDASKSIVKMVKAKLRGEM